MKIPSHFKKLHEYPNGSFMVVLVGDPWMIPRKVYFCPCEDGKPRTVRLKMYPDTAFSIGGSVSVKGKTVTGFVTCDENGYKFLANKFGKNWSLMQKAMVEASNDN